MDGKSQHQEQGSPEVLRSPEHPQAKGEAGGKGRPPSRTRLESDSRWQKWVAVTSLVFDLIIAVCAILGGFFVARQLQLMREDNLMTRQSIESADRESEATLAAMQDIANVMRDTLTESRSQSDAALEQSRLYSEASLEHASESLEHSRRVFEATQRARLVVDRFDFDYEPKSGSALVGRATAYIRNTGALPATEVRWRSFLVEAGPQASIMHSGDVERELSKLLMLSDHPTTVVGAGAVVALRPYSHSPGLVEKPPMYCTTPLCFFYGRVQYIDGFDNWRTLDFCQFLAPWENTNWIPCFYANSAD